MVDAPNVVGSAQATAEANIVSAQLVVGTVTTASSPTVPAGDVISQNPAGSSSVAIGSSVDIVVSTGPAGDADDAANADIIVAGSVSGSYVDTQASDDGYQSITEIESGGKPNNRHSYLEHKWTINVTGGNAVTFFVEAYQSASSDGDNFVFAYSTNDSSYTNMVTVSKTSDDDSYQSYSMPAALSGTVYIRVTDTDATSGNRGLDTISIDDMFIRSAAPGPPDTDAPTPDPMTFATAPYSTGSSSIAMAATAASDASPVEYYFTATDGGNDSGWQDSTSYEDTGLSPSTLYSYTVTARDKSAAQNATSASSAASATTDVASVLPAPPSSLSLTAISTTEIDLSWTDNASDETGFKIERSKSGNTAYVQVATVGANVTSYSDTGLKKNTTYYYRVRATNANGDSAYCTEDSVKTPR
jgi:hypothetical protein